MRKTWQLIVLFAAVAGMLAGCAAVGPDKKDAKKKKDKILWPAPPEQPRFKFAGVLRAASDIVQESDEAQVKRKLTGLSSISDKPVIDKPTGIAVRFGLVYVAEPTAKAVTVFDMQRRKVFRFGWREPNALKHPQAIATDREGQVYVLDSELHKLMIFDNIGLFLRSIDLKIGYTNPVAVAVNPDGKTIYIVDRGDLGNDDHKVVAYSAEGKEIFRLGARGGEDGKFNIPLAAVVAEDNTLYVADGGNFRIQAFDGEGKFKFAFGKANAGPGGFSRPRSVAVDPAGNIYVSDGGFNNVQIFNPQGELLMPLGGLSRDPGPGNYAFIGSIAVDETGVLLVNDHYFKKIEVFLPLSDAEGQRLMVEE